MNLVEAVPLPYRILAGVIFIGVVFGLGWSEGSGSVQAEWDKANAKQALRVYQVKEKQAAATVQVVTEYIDRVKVVHDKGETLIKEIPTYVQNDTCTLPAGFRVLHDSAARGELPDPASVAHAAPVSAQDLAATIASNYAQSIALAEQLSALQAWIKQMKAVQP